MKTVILMMEENIFGRALIQELLNSKKRIDAIIIEKGTDRSAKMLEYLKNDFFNPPSLEKLIAEKNIPIHEVSDINGNDTKNLLEKIQPELVVLGGSSRLIKPDIIKLASVGIMNVHPGFLPEYPGMDVVGWAIHNNDIVGTTVHFIDEGVDSGPILLKEKVDQVQGDNLLKTRVRVMKAGVRLISTALMGIYKGTLKAVPQSHNSKEHYRPMPPEVIKSVEEKLKISMNKPQEKTDKKISFLGGEKVFLRPVESGDALKIAKWINDPEVTHYMFYGQMPTNREQAEEFIMSHVKDLENVVFMICDKQSKRAIGFGGLYHLHFTAHHAEFRVLIGEKDLWGGGRGTETTELLTFYGFDRLNLHKVYLGVTSENKGAIKAYERAGYIYEGVLRDDIYRNSRYYDMVKMSILRDEYYEKHYTTHVKKFRPWVRAYPETPSSTA